MGSDCQDAKVTGRLDAPLSAELIKHLLDAGQGGEAERVVDLCEARLAHSGRSDHLERFWLRYVEVFCAQSADIGIDQDRIVVDMLTAAEACALAPALAAALACRALLAATRGRFAEANADLARAVVLLSDLDGPSTEDWPQRHGRRMACNTLALAFSRQGFHDLAVQWLQVTRQLIDSHGVGDRFGLSIVTFNEARVHLAAGIERDLGEEEVSTRARDSYRRAAALFAQAEREAGLEPGRSPVIGPGRVLAAVAATLGGAEVVMEDLVDRCGHQVRRPDHRALRSLALARAHAARGGTGKALELLERARSSLPPDHSFRSMVARIQWETIRITRATSPDAQSSAHRGMVDILLEERRSESRARRAAYEERLRQEVDRAALLAERAAVDIDPLTGLLTRRNLDARLRAASALSDGRRAFVVFLDLDQFKLVNDRRSHLAGDLTLRYLGETLRPALLGDDFAVRYGGDEFILVLFDRSPHGVQQELSLLRAQLVELTSAHPEIRTPVTFTAGVLPLEPAAAPDDLLHRADLAMIAEKVRARPRDDLRQVGAQRPPTPT